MKDQFFGSLAPLFGYWSKSSSSVSFSMATARWEISSLWPILSGALDQDVPPWTIRTDWLTCSSSSFERWREEMRIEQCSLLTFTICLRSPQWVKKLLFRSAMWISEGLSEWHWQKCKKKGIEIRIQFLFHWREWKSASRRCSLISRFPLNVASRTQCSWKWLMLSARPVKIFSERLRERKGYTSLPIDHWQTKGSLLRNRRKSSRQFNKEWEESVDWLYCILHISSVFDQSNNWFLPPMKENEQRSQERFERCHCLWFASTDRRNRGRDGGEQSSASKCQTSLDDRQWPKTCEGKDHDVRKRDFSSSTSSEKRSRSIAFVSCANWSETVRPTSDFKSLSSFCFAEMSEEDSMGIRFDCPFDLVVTLHDSVQDWKKILSMIDATLPLKSINRPNVRNSSIDMAFPRFARLQMLLFSSQRRFLSTRRDLAVFNAHLLLFPWKPAEKSADRFTRLLRSRDFPKDDHFLEEVNDEDNETQTVPRLRS